jgi:hypothetical protein
MNADLYIVALVVVLVVLTPVVLGAFYAAGRDVPSADHDLSAFGESRYGGSHSGTACEDGGCELDHLPPYKRRAS